MVPLAPSHPPWVVSFLVSFLSALEVPRGDHSLKDSQQSVVRHERAPTQELVELFGGTPAHSSVSTRLVGGSFCGSPLSAQ